MTFDAIRIVQGSDALYVMCLPAKHLVDPKKVSVDRWDPKNREGYQREPVAARAREYADYIGKAQGMTPNSVLLNIRKEIDGFAPARKGSVVGTLTIPDGEQLWIVDGQHRIEGLRLLLERSPEFGDYPVPVVLTVGNGRYDEARQFVIVNKTQKGVVPDLAERLIADKLRAKESAASKMHLPRAINRDMSWIGQAMGVTDKLNETVSDTASSPFHGNPWCGRIQLPNTKRGKALVRQKAFTDSLKNLVIETLSGYSSEEVAAILCNYWKAILSLWRGAAKSPRDYMVQRTMGVSVFHLLLPRILRLVAEHHGKLTEKNFHHVLKAMREHFDKDGEGDPDAYWSNDGMAGRVGTSRKAVGFVLEVHKYALDAAYKAKPAKLASRPFDM